MIQGIAQQGFTLVELLIVLIIIGISSSFAIPSLWGSYVRTQERSVVNGIANALLHIRLDSFHNGELVTISAVTASQPKAPSIFPEMINGWVLLSSDELRFLPNGVTNGGTMLLDSPREHHWRLTLTPLTGHVLIEER